MVSLYLFCIFGMFAVTTVLVARHDPDWARFYHPWVIVASIYLLYTISPLANINAGAWQQELEEFLFFQTLGMLGLSLGCLSVLALAHRAPAATPSPKLPSSGSSIILTALGVNLLLVIFVIGRYEHGIATIILEGYQTGFELTPMDTILMAFPIFLSIVLILVHYLHYGWSRRILLGTLFYAVIMLLGGHRNIFILLTGGLLMLHSLKHKRLSYFRLSGLAAAAYIFLMLIGLYRNFGLNGYSMFTELCSEQGAAILNPSSQELNTSFNTFFIYRNHPGWETALWPGESYWRTVESVIPRLAWPNRPDSIANDFSRHFAARGEGVGFSNNLEAFINFGFPGLIIVNGIIMMVMVLVYNRMVVDRVSPLGIAYYAVLPFVSFNLNRIDVQSVFKMSGIAITMFVAVDAALRRIPTTRRVCSPNH